MAKFWADGTIKYEDLAGLPTLTLPGGREYVPAVSRNTKGRTCRSALVSAISNAY
jgi:hypothetical protein